MNLVSSFAGPLQQLALVMTAPSFAGLVTVLSGRGFPQRRTVTRMILAADAAAPPGRAGKAKHHSTYHRLFAAARWSIR